MESKISYLDYLIKVHFTYKKYQIIGFSSDFKPLTPGLETKFALQEAEKVGAKTFFGGK